MKTKPESQQQQHTPTPWKISGQHILGADGIAGDMGATIVHIVPTGLLPDKMEKYANQRLIVEAVNSYAKLKRDNEAFLSACKKMVEKTDSAEWQWADLSGYVAFELPKIIAQAEGK